MTNLPSWGCTESRKVLLSHGGAWTRNAWLGGVDDVLRPSGFVVCRAHTGADTIRQVEEGGLAGAVLVEDRERIDGLSLLRIIRSIDRHLPCWLVTERANRRTLEVALSLRVVSVMAQPLDLSELTRTLTGFLSDRANGN